MTITLTTEQRTRLLEIIDRPIIEPGHTAHVRRDSDWGGPNWSWGECACGWKSTVYSDAPHGDVLPGSCTDAIRDVLIHADVNTGALLNAYIQQTARLSFKFRLGEDMLRADAIVSSPENPAGATFALHTLDSLADAIAYIREGVFDAHLLHTIATSDPGETDPQVTS